jgi:gamma-glutamyltranspeptidase/glutathione hydrolase
VQNNLDWDLPYTSRRAPVLAQNMVATAQPVAAQVGISILQRGGNAVDAALATAIALTVLEPVSAGLGGDAFAVIWDGKRVHGLNGSGRSPLALSAERFAGLNEMPELGWDSVTVPGVVSTWAAMSQKFGRLPFKALFEPAVRYARDGYHLTPLVARQWRSLHSTYKEYPDALAYYYPKGRSPELGEVLTAPELADSLEIVAESGGTAFYEGYLAKKIVAHARAAGADLDQKDLSLHTADWVDPIPMPYRNAVLYELPPSGQGLAALSGLGILNEFDLSACPLDGADSIHLQVEAMKLALADTYAEVGDLAHMRVGCEELLDRKYLQSRSRSISMSEARYPVCGRTHSGGTTYLATADRDGLMVSYIQSCGRGFGSGIVVPGTGIALQSRGRAFTTERGHPNCIGPGKRPFHTNIPAFVTMDGRARACIGLAGWTMQPQAHLQFMVRLLDYRQNPQSILDGPRWRIALEEPAIVLEPQIGAETRAELTRRGHQIVETEKFSLARTPRGSAAMFGGAQMICKIDNGYVGASDGRRDGQVLGF